MIPEELREVPATLEQLVDVDAWEFDFVMDYLEAWGESADGRPTWRVWVSVGGDFRIEFELGSYIQTGDAAGLDELRRLARGMVAASEAMNAALEADDA